MEVKANKGRHTLRDNLDPTVVPEPALIRLCLFLATSAGTTLEGRDLVVVPFDRDDAGGLEACGCCFTILAADSFRTKIP